MPPKDQHTPALEIYRHCREALHFKSRLHHLVSELVMPEGAMIMKGVIFF